MFEHWGLQTRKDDFVTFHDYEKDTSRTQIEIYLETCREGRVNDAISLTFPLFHNSSSIAMEQHCCS